MSVKDGTIVSNTSQLNVATTVTAVSADKTGLIVLPLPSSLLSSPLLFTSRYHPFDLQALTADPTDNAPFYLAKMDPQTGVTTKLGSSSFLDGSWTPSGISISVPARRWVNLLYLILRNLFYE